MRRRCFSILSIAALTCPSRLASRRTLGQSLAHLLLDALFQLRSENIRRRHQLVRLEHGRVQLVRPPPRGRPITRKNLNLPTTTTLTKLQLIPAYKDQPHQQTPATTR